jgi:curved DNA-binding protein CbpA
MIHQDPFAVLGLEPTVDPAAIKQAYFAALRQHPPHTDPEGFRRVRTAYEALATAKERSRTYWLAPLDREAERARLGDLEPRIAEALREYQRQGQTERDLAALAATAPRRTWAQALHGWGQGRGGAEQG